MSEKKKQEAYEKSETIPKVQGKVWDFLSDLAMGRKWVYIANTDEAEALSAEITRMLMSIEYRWALHDLYALVKKVATKDNFIENMEVALKNFLITSNKETRNSIMETIKGLTEILEKEQEIEKIMKGVGL